VVKDCTGKVIEVGSQIAYPGRCGSGMWMNTGEVIGIDTYTQYWNHKKAEYLKVKRDKGGKVVSVYNIHYCVVTG
jgi:hypothetical protein